MKVYRYFDGNDDLILLAMPKSKDKFLGIIYAFNWWGARYELSPVKRKTYTKKQLDEMECLGETNNEYIFNMGSSFSTSYLERKPPLPNGSIQCQGHTVAYYDEPFNVQVVREQNGSVHLEINNRSL